MKTVLLLFCSLLSLAALSQKSNDKEQGNNPLSVGQNQINAGVGLSSWGIPLYFGIDHCFQKDITFGAEVSYRRYHHKWVNDYYDDAVFGIYLNGNYHFNNLLNIPSNWDFYAGLNLGFNYWNFTNDKYKDSHTSGIGIGGQIGGRYYFSDKFGINLEFGGGNAFSQGKFGISIKL